MRFARMAIGQVAVSDPSLYEGLTQKKRRTNASPRIRNSHTSR